MFKVLGAAAAAVTISYAGGANAATHVIDFESYTVGQVLAPSYPFFPRAPLAGTPYDVAFALGAIVDANGGKALAIQGGGWNLRFDGDYIGQDDPDTGSHIYYRPTILSFDYYAAAPATVQNESIGSVDLTPGSWQTFTYAWAVGPNAYNIRFSDDVLIDNIRVLDGFAAVPEPATWAMLIVGFALTGSALRRRRKPALNVSATIIP